MHATNFPAGDSIRVALCSTITSAADPSCLYGTWESQLWDPLQVPINVSPATSNSTSVALPLFIDAAGQGNRLLPAQDVTGVTGTVPGFNCDNAATRVPSR